jgi:site-specific DNA-methyltransferase (adenine-specific)
MKTIPDNSIDLVLTDPPYGTTKCKWDSIIPFEPMWAELKRIRKEKSAICLFGSEPFSSHLRMSNIDFYKYDWTWDKSVSGSFAQAKRMPLRTTENVSIFAFDKTHPRYFPQMVKREKTRKIGGIGS